MVGKIIVFEGIDGVGKTTQSCLLSSVLEDMGYRVRNIHFPRVNVKPYGDLIASFLRGELGSKKDTSPELISLLYALDRKEILGELQGWLNAGEWVIIDRYVYSNLAYQRARIGTVEDKLSFTNWLIDLEFTYHQLPKPDIVFLLLAPFELTKRNLQARKKQNRPDYLLGKEDIYEADLTYQQKVKEEFLTLFSSDLKHNFHLVDYIGKDGELLSLEQVKQSILDVLNSNRIFN